MKIILIYFLFVIAIVIFINSIIEFVKVTGQYNREIYWGELLKKDEGKKIIFKMICTFILLNTMILVYFIC